MFNGCQLFLGDCLEKLKEIPDKSVDLVLTDPPYGKKWARGLNGIGVVKKKNEKFENLFWDSETPNKVYFEQILRVGKSVLIFGGNYFTDVLPISNCWLVWDKRGETPRGQQIPFADCELIWTNLNKTIKKYVCVNQGFIRDSKDERLHPTQKPTELILDILKDFSKENDLILDPFMGSGTTGVAALKLQRRFIGIEINPEYFAIAEKRINDWKNQSRLTSLFSGD